MINNTTDNNETDKIEVTDAEVEVTKRYSKEIWTQKDIKYIFEKLSREQIIQLIFFLMFIFNINDSDLPNHQPKWWWIEQESPPTWEWQWGWSIEWSVWTKHLRTLKDKNDEMKKKQKRWKQWWKKWWKKRWLWWEWSTQESKSTWEWWGWSRQKSPPKKS
jgi:hypothetical protein